MWVLTCAAMALVFVASTSSSMASAERLGSTGTHGRIVFGREMPALDDFASFTLKPNGTSEKRLLPGASVFPRWSPDGTEIALLTCANPPDCTTAAAIVDPATGDVSRWFPSPDPELFLGCTVWSAGGSRLACEGFGEPRARRNGIYSLRSSDGKGLRRITSNPGGDDLPGDYGPGGKRIVFLRIDPDRSKGKDSALFIKPVDRSRHARRITPWGLSDESGSWSPNGRRILFAGNGRLYTVRVSAGGAISRIPLPRRGGAFDPAWSPNGQRIVFGFFPAGSSRSDIWTARSNGTKMNQVTNTKRSEHFPDWGATG
jgi:Tol biopolymer transport system component